MKLPEGRSNAEFVLLDNRLSVANMFNHLIYLYDEESQQKLLKDPNSQPYITLTYCKKVNFTASINKLAESGHADTP